MIICEGVDSTGKSTLARKLAIELRATYHHASGHRSLWPAMHEHHKNMLDCAEVNLANGHDVVFDRHWPSELCYASILRPELVDKYPFTQMMDRLGALNQGGQHSVHYIFATPEGLGWQRYQETHAGHDTRVFQSLTEAQYYAINCEYKSLFVHLPHIRYYIEDGPTLDDVLDQITGRTPVRLHGVHK